MITGLCLFVVKGSQWGDFTDNKNFEKFCEDFKDQTETIKLMREMRIDSEENLEKFIDRVLKYKFPIEGDPGCNGGGQDILIKMEGIPFFKLAKNLIGLYREGIIDKHKVNYLKHWEYYDLQKQPTLACTVYTDANNTFN